MVVVGLYLIGRSSQSSSLEQIGMRSARQIVETRESLEAEDLAEMLAAFNARRRARGERELSVEDVELRVSRDQAAMEGERERYTPRPRADPDADSRWSGI